MDENKFWLSCWIVVGTVIGSMALAGIANNFFTDYVAMKSGLHMVQNIGTSGYHWEK